MTNRTDKCQAICDKLQKLGYAREKHIKLYGEDLQLVSNPVPEGNGFAVEGVARTSGNLIRVRIPLTLVYRAQKEVAFEETVEMAG
jgi:hypothetical protein